MADLSASFKKPFPEQVAAFRLRLGNLVPTAAWDDLKGAAHDRGFMVAGAMKADLLADLAVAVDKAIAEGTGLEAFRRDFRDIVTKRGWHGWTGEGSKGGEAWRTRVIYRTNMRTSYMAGRYAQLKAAKFKFWVYRHGGSLEPRPQHLAWDGLILAADHPFWATHYPPNDWGCSCRVFGARSLAGAKRKGGIAGKKLAEGWQALDRKTGTAPGIGKGWDHAPGGSVADIVHTMAEKSVSWPHHLAKAYMQSLPRNNADLISTSYRALPSHRDGIRRYVAQIEASKKNAPSLNTMKSFGLLTSKQVEQVKRETSVQAKGFDFTLDVDAVKHVFKQHGNDKTERARGQRAVTPDDFGLIGLLLNSPDSVTFDGETPEQGPVFKYVKLVGRERFTAVFAVKRRRQRLKLITFYVGLSGKSPP